MKDNGASKCKNKKMAEASLTIEAALGLTLFLFLVVLLIMPMKMLNTQRRVQMVLEAASRELSEYAYIRYRLSVGDETVLQNEQGPEALVGAGVKELFEKAALSVYLTKKIYEAAGVGRVEQLDFSKLKVGEEEIDLYVSYRLRLPFSVFSLNSVPAAARSFRRGWIGSQGGRTGLGRDNEEGDEKLVYVGNSMGRYHWFKDCHYISNQITSVSSDSIKEQQSSSGSRYRPCSVCGKKAYFGSQVYIMPNGAYYHARKDCSSIAYYVRQIPLSEAAHLGECSYCSRMKGE